MSASRTSPLIFNYRLTLKRWRFAITLIHLFTTQRLIEIHSLVIEFMRLENIWTAGKVMISAPLRTRTCSSTCLWGGNSITVTIDSPIPKDQHSHCNINLITPWFKMYLALYSSLWIIDSTDHQNERIIRSIIHQVSYPGWYWAELTALLGWSVSD